MWRDLWLDVRYGLRTLAKSPGFTVVAVLTLALGIGATSAVFSVINGVLLRPFPFADPERLVVVWEYIPSHPLKYMVASPPDFADWRGETTVLETAAVFSPSDLNRTDGAQPERIQGARVSGDLFPMLGVPPELGRALRPEDDVPGAPGVVVLSYGYWQTNFGGARDVLGRSLTLNGEAFQIVGIMPQSFTFPVPFGLARSVPAPPAAMWIPFRLNYAAGQRGAHSLFTIARLREGISLRQAEAAMMALGARIAENEAGHRERSIRLFGLREQVGSGVSGVLYVLLGAVGLVLLIACANVANMQLARATIRAREMALRSALGAGRARLVRMLLAESTLLSVLGGAVGLLLAAALVRAVVALGPGSIPRLSEVTLDWRAAAFAFVVAVAVGILFGLVPAAQVSRGSPVSALKEGGRAGSAAGGSRMRQALVVAEVGLSLVLLISAGLLVKSFLQLHQVSFGFDRSRTLAAGIALPARSYTTSEQRAQFFERLLDGLSSRPEVEAAGAVLALPLATNRQGTGLEIEGRPAGDFEITVAFGLATPGYLSAMKIPIVRGRDFTPSDRSGQPWVAIVNEELARQFFSGQDPIGQRIRIGNASDKVLEIVGVSGNVRHDLTEFADGVRPMVWRPYAQSPAGLPVSLVVRSRMQDPAALVSVVRGQVAQLDPNLPIYDVRSMDAVFDSAMAQPRFSTTVLGLFSALALALGAVGIYGVVSYSVTQRTRELGIRVALGAQRRDVLRLVIGQGLRLVALGVTLGLVASLGLVQVMRNLLFGVSARDPLLLGGVSLLLLLVAVAACWIPARRASRVDPMVALRYE